MEKTVHQVVLFVEEQEDDWSTPLKVGNLCFNRFGSEEDAAFESVGVYHLQKSSDKMSNYLDKEYKNFESERKEKGMGITKMESYRSDRSMNSAIVVL